MPEGSEQLLTSLPPWVQTLASVAVLFVVVIGAVATYLRKPQAAPGQHSTTTSLQSISQPLIDKASAEMLSAAIERVARVLEEAMELQREEGRDRRHDGDVAMLRREIERLKEDR